ncbi:hypothetical protein CDL15_Pgr002059 [Punica granatum]|uniref:Myb/SANT-like DNA-binding domain-containing protein n=1 Tax=Punica granatum TaxID=22663 RepID=A0A218XC33_PUNGR|nr:hypothetical protein CDL15_Pgr002059 [Punica granatum]
MFSGMGSGMLGLEMPPHQTPSNAQNPNSLQHPQIVGFDPHHSQSQQIKPTGYQYSSSKSKQQLTLSEDDEHDDNSAGDPKKSGNNSKSSPWQRMKWTDTMVRLLIMAVFYIGDEVGSEPNDPKKKSGGLLQKKGKWKSVSRAMMEKGFYVSPQQCEDKFNDLNKRYKRVNDILGKGTACRVVENQGLLETMDLSPKMKEEVKKLLNSKHLFFREMCAYHTSCGHGVAPGGSSGAHNSPEQHQQQQQQRCPHGATENHLPMGEKDIPSRAEADSSKVAGRGGSGEEEYDDDEDDDSEDGENDDDDEDVQEDHEHENDVWNLNHPRKRPRKFSYSPSPAVVQQLNGEVLGIIQDSVRSPWEKKQWVKGKLLQLEEQQVRYRGEAYELERQRLKWLKFSVKKEREMERAKLENERRMLENQRLVLLLRQRELELLDPQQHQHQQNSSNKRSDPS